MKRAILPFFFSLIFTGFAQESIPKVRKVERLWVSANCSFNKYQELGAHVQIFDQFLIGAYFQNFKREVGPGVPRNPYAMIRTEHDYKMDRVRSGSLMIGIASPTPHSVMFSFLAGPSLNRSVTHTDFDVSYSTNSTYYTYPVSVSSTTVNRWKMGLNYKATFSFIIKNRVCISVGLAGNYNGVDNYNRFIFGVGGGEFGSRKRKRTKQRLVDFE